MPTNLYGTHDNFDLTLKFYRGDDANSYEVKENNNVPVTLWERNP
jgi:GDP-L-fucose synthase